MRRLLCGTRRAEAVDATECQGSAFDFECVQHADHGIRTFIQRVRIRWRRQRESEAGHIETHHAQAWREQGEKGFVVLYNVRSFGDKHDTRLGRLGIEHAYRARRGVHHTGDQ